MESLAAFPDGEWDSFNRLMFSTEELDLTHQILHHQFSFPSEHDEGLSFITSSTMCPTPEANMSNIAGTTVNEYCLLYSSNFHYNSQESSSQSSNSSGSVFVSPPNPETNYYLSGSTHVAVANDATMSLDISMDVDGVSDNITGSFPPPFPNIARNDEDLSTDSLGKLLDASQPAAGFALANELLLKSKFDVLELHGEGDKMMNANSSENTKKRLRVPKDAPKVYKNVQSKRNRKMMSSNGNEGESSSTCSSEDDNVSQETNGVENSDSKPNSQALNLNGKTRASRGSATDPQSLYARKRRERINQRLRVLQNLVPNGTKVDISTMLEEAVHYVKFLQLQIKLLSSDELWMYAPIAYNGIDIGLNKNISTLL